MKKRNIYCLCAIEWLQGMVFYSSVATLYRLHRGLSLTQMGMIESLFSICVFLFEVPCGMLGDRIGYKKMLMSCYGIYVLSKIVFFYADDFSLFLLERVLLALSMAGLSGCDTSFLYLSSGKDDGPRVFGYFQACGTVGMVLSSMIFSLYLQDETLAAMWTIVPYTLAFGLSFFLQDIPLERKSSFPFQDIRLLWQQQKKMIWFLIACALVLETTHTIAVFYSQLHYQLSQIPLSAFGWLSIMMMGVSLGSAMVGKAVRHLGERYLLFLLIILAMGSCMLLAVLYHPFFSVFSIALLSLVEAMYRPLSQSLMNKSVQGHWRITALSLYSMVMNMIGVVTNVCFGVSGDQGVAYVMSLGAVFCLLALFCLWRDGCQGMKSQ